MGCMRTHTKRQRHNLPGTSGRTSSSTPIGAGAIGLLRPHDVRRLQRQIQALL
jgi:hypothetical protein